MITEIKVTKNDIKRGLIQGDKCPVARAINRKLKGIYCFAMKRQVEIKDRLIDLPNEIIKFIHDFDGGYTVKPIKFSLNIHKRYLK